MIQPHGTTPDPRPVVRIVESDDDFHEPQEQVAAEPAEAAERCVADACEAWADEWARVDEVKSLHRQLSSNETSWRQSGSRSSLSEGFGRLAGPLRVASSPTQPRIASQCDVLDSGGGAVARLGRSCSSRSTVGALEGRIDHKPGSGTCGDAGARAAEDTTPTPAPEPPV